VIAASSGSSPTRSAFAVLEADSERGLADPLEQLAELGRAQVGVVLDGELHACGRRGARGHP